MKSLKYLIALIIILICINSQGQSPMRQKIETHIDRLGNATLKISMSMNAQQWEMWNSNYGNNPAALKRETERAMPGYFLDDFKLEKDDMNRSFVLTLKAYGMCEINKRGDWIIRTDEKDVQVTELGGRKYMMVVTPEEFGGSIQQTHIINFPDEADDIEIEKDAFGETIFKFDMKKPSNLMIDLLRWPGLLLIVIGGAMTFLNMRKGTA